MASRSSPCGTSSPKRASLDRTLRDTEPPYALLTPFASAVWRAMMRAMHTLLLAMLLSQPAAAEPLPCCDARVVDNLLTPTLNLHRALAYPDAHGARLNSHFYALIGAATTAAKARELAPAERASADRIRAAAESVKNKKAGPEIHAALSTIALEVAAIARRHPGGKDGLAELQCGTWFWLQRASDPPIAPYPDCTPVPLD